MKLYHLILSLFIPCMLLACDRQNAEHDVAVQDTDNITHGKLLATIDGRKIYEEDLQSLLVDMFGEYRAQTIEGASRKQALNSLIASYALAREAEKELAPEVIADIGFRVNRHRENQLINAYIKTKINPDLLTNDRIKSYYEDNMEKFGKRTIKQYHVLTTNDELPEEQRDNYLSLVAGAKKTDDLEKISNVLKNNGYNVQLQSAELNKDLLDERLYQFVNAQKLNSLSELTFVNGKPYLIKIVAEKVIAAKPLTEVSNIIRNNLALEQLRVAIKRQSESVFVNSEVVYFE